MLDTAYFGGLRISELVSLIWSQVIRRDNGEAQLEVLGKGDKVRQVLIPIETRRGCSLREWHRRLYLARCGDPDNLTERAVNYVVKAAAKRAGVNPAVSVHWLRHAHASHAIDNGAPITLVSATLGHADLKTTSVLLTLGQARAQGGISGRNDRLASIRRRDELLFLEAVPEFPEEGLHLQDGGNNWLVVWFCARARCKRAFQRRHDFRFDCLKPAAGLVLVRLS
jgi:Phage integrase family